MACLASPDGDKAETDKGDRNERGAFKTDGNRQEAGKPDQ